MDAFELRTDAIAAQHGTFDRTTERAIRTLRPRAQEAARAFMTRMLGARIPARIISGTRTYGEQNALFRKGRFGNPGPIVTKARGGRSNHNFGIAWDIGIFENGAYSGSSPLYARAAEAGLTSGLEWGGNWKSFKDLPHYQLSTQIAIAAVRASFENGVAYV